MGRGPAGRRWHRDLNRGPRDPRSVGPGEATQGHQDKEQEKARAPGTASRRRPGGAAADPGKTG